MALSREEREEFLAQAHIGSLAVEAGDGRAPLVVPTWYQYMPGGELWFTTGTESRKLGLIRQSGRLSILAQRLEPTIRYVSVAGQVDRYEEMTRADLEEMAARYLPAEKVGPYVDFAIVDHGPQTKVVLRPQQWVSLDLGSI